MLGDDASRGDSDRPKDAFFVIDADQRIVHWSDAAASLLATPAGSAIGQPCYAVVRGCDPFGRPICGPECRAMQAVRAGHLKSARLLATDLGVDSTRLRCEVHALPRGTGGAIVHMATRDGTGNEPLHPASSANTEEPIARLLGDLAALATLATSLSAGSVFDRLDALLDLVREALGAESAELFLAEPDGGDLLLTAYRGPFRRAFCEIPRFKPAEGLPGLAAASLQPVVTEDLRVDWRYRRELVKAKGFRSYICVPLRVEGAPIGVICAGSRRGTVARDEARRFLTWASIPIATALSAGLLQASRDATPDAAWFREDDGRPEHLLGEILGRIRRKVGADGATLVLRLPEGAVERVIDGDLAPPTCPSFDDEGETARCPVIAGGHGVALYGPRHDWPEACRQLHRDGSVTYCVPLPVADCQIGILHLAYRDDPPCPPTRQLGPAVQVAAQAGPLASMAWRAIEQQRLLELRPAWVLEDDEPESPRPDRFSIDNRSLAPADSGAVATEPRLHVRCFGGFELRLEGLLVMPEAFKRRQALTLFKILLTHAGRPVSKETLIEYLWPESDPRLATRRLHVIVHALREVIEPDNSRGDWVVIQSAPEGYTFAPTVPYWFDLAEFRAAIERGRHAEERRAAMAAAVAYDAAIRLYRGDYCEDDRFAEWCWLEREQWRETYLDTLQRLAALRAELGELECAIHHYRQVLRADPLRESAQQHLIECLWAVGRRAEALEHYALFRDLLQHELDIAPSAEIEALVQRIRVTPAR